MLTRFKRHAVEALETPLAVYEDLRVRLMREYQIESLPTLEQLGYDPLKRIREEPFSLRWQRNTDTKLWFVETVDEASRFCDRLARIIWILYHGFHEVTWNEIRPCVAKYFVLSLSRTASANWKYHTNWICCHAMGERPPERGATVLDKDGFILGGDARRAQTRYLGSTTKKSKLRDEVRINVAASFLRSKQGLPKLSMMETLEDLRGHARTLSQKPSGTVDAAIVAKAREIVADIFDQCKNYFSREVDLSLASASSCLRYPRAMGGERGWLRHKAEIFRNFGTVEPSVDVSMGVDLSGHVDFRIHVDDRAPILKEDWLRGGQSQHARARVAMEAWFSENSDLPEWEFQVKVVQEALKTRPITVGDGDLYYHLKPLQKYLQKSLAAHRQFALTGRPLEETDIDPLLFERKWYKMCNLDECFVSGDYKGATDRLDVRLTLAIFMQIMEALGIGPGDPLYDMGFFSLMPGGKIRYDSSLDYVKSEQIERGVQTHIPIGPDPVTQENGQLMGSILSFPILCIANLATYLCIRDEFNDLVEPDLKPIEIAGRVLPTDDLSWQRSAVLVNGDDILFAASKRFARYWRANIGRAGFVESIGKNYTSPDFFTINSRFYTIRRGRLIEAGYVNLGLVFDEGKSVVTDDRMSGVDLSPFPVVAGRIADAIVASVPDRIRDQCMEWFIEYHRKDLNVPLLNWFIPLELGGLGLPRTRSVEITKAQRKLAAMLSTHPELTPPLLDAFKFCRKAKHGLRPGKVVRWSELGSLMTSRTWPDFLKSVQTIAKQATDHGYAWSLREQLDDPVEPRRAYAHAHNQIRKQFSSLVANSLAPMSDDAMIEFESPCVLPDWVEPCLPIKVTC